ncbi:MAG: autotransporter domain-containing protein [Rhizobiales bacterium]|nr:autotransporter domain-containing protein [Hyphomicrobiales bacterium]
MLAGTSLAGVLSIAGFGGGAARAEPLPPAPPLDFVTIDYGSNSTFFTGIRGDNLVGNYVIPGTADTGGLLYRSDTGAWVPFTEATANGVNYPDAYSSSPYGPTFGSPDGILRVVGVYKTGSSPYNLGYLYDGAAAPGSEPITLIYPEISPTEPTLFTFPHSQFGNTVVGDYDTGLKTGNVFIYDIPTGTFTTNNKPGAVSTTAYGIYGDKIAGGYGPGPGGEPGFEHGYIYDRTTDTWTSYEHPDAIFTHFEGISGAGRGNEYNLVVDYIDVEGQKAAVLHVDAEGNETWIPLVIEGANTVSANSIYGDTAVGIYTDADGTHAYSVKIPGIYNPLTNDVKLSSDAAGAVLIAAEKGDDVVNNGTVRVTGPNAIGIRGETYGVLNNYGKVVATGQGSAAVDMNGQFGTLLNGGIIRAAKGADAVRADGTAEGSTVVNAGVIDGRVRVVSGPYTRFENSGWIGASGDGAGMRHVVNGVYAQTADGVLALRVKGAKNDVLEVGTARLDGTVAAVVIPGKGLTRKHTLVAGEEITGTFASLETFGLPAYFKSSLDYSATAVDLKLKAKLGEAGGLTRNERAVGNAFDRAFNQGGEIPDDVAAALFALGEEDLPTALSASSGEIFATQQSVLINQGLFVREAMLGRLRQGPAAGGGGADLALSYAGVPGESPTAAAFAPDPSFWAQGLGAWGKIDGDGNAAEVTTDFGGLIGGLDTEVSDRWSAGIAFGYTQSHADVDDLDSSADTQTGLVGAYVGGELGAWRVRGGGSYGLNFVDTSRSVSYPGYSETNTASYQAGLGQLFGEVAYAADLHGVALEPFAGLAWSHLHSDGFTEKGGASALSVDSANADVGYTTLGIRLAGRHVLGNGVVLVPRASIAWQYAFGDLTPEAALSFADASDLAFTVAGTPLAQNAALIDAGLDIEVSRALRIGLSYYGQLSSEGSDNAVRGSLTWKF